MRVLVLSMIVSLASCGAPAPRERAADPSEGDETTGTTGTGITGTTGTTSTTGTASTTGTDAGTATTTAPPPERNGTCLSPCTEHSECDDARGWRCTCEWIHDVNCGGAQRPLMPPTLGLSCAPRDTSADRGDGCPFAAPREHARCTGASTAACLYPSDGCGYSGTQAQCVGGRWALAGYAMPPPP